MMIADDFIRPVGPCLSLIHEPELIPCDGPKLLNPGLDSDPTADSRKPFHTRYHRLLVAVRHVLFFPNKEDDSPFYPKFPSQTANPAITSTSSTMHRSSSTSLYSGADKRPVFFHRPLEEAYPENGGKGLRAR